MSEQAFIPVNEPLLNGNELRYLEECIKTGWISSEGPFVTRFEQEMAARVQRRHGIAVTNGTAALEAAVVALGIGPGDEVIMPAFTIISCASAVVRAGATPVLVDACSQTWNIDTEAIETRITPRTKALLVVHIYGLPTDMAPVLALAQKYGLKIIEDAAEVHGQTYDGKPCGSFGDLSIFSFYPNKHVTSGEGGMIVTNCDALAERCRDLRNLCFLKQRRFVHEELGWNLRMTNLQAAIGVAQLERLDEFVERKRAMGALYHELLSETEGIELQQRDAGYSQNIFWVFGIVLKDEIPMDAQEAMKRLASKGVGTRPFFWPMHRQPVFQKMGLFHGETYSVAERIADRGFYLPSGMALTGAQIRQSASALQEILKDI
jgi:perosamine synthetase